MDKEKTAYKKEKPTIERGLSKEELAEKSHQRDLEKRGRKKMQIGKKTQKVWVKMLNKRKICIANCQLSGMRCPGDVDDHSDVKVTKNIFAEFFKRYDGTENELRKKTVCDLKEEAKSLIFGLGKLDKMDEKYHKNIENKISVLGEQFRDVSGNNL